MWILRRPESSFRGFLQHITSKFERIIHTIVVYKLALSYIQTDNVNRFDWTRGREWNSPKKNCQGELGPLSGSTYPAGAPPEAGVVSKVLSTIKNPVYLLDITTLSQLRKDAHPSTYGGDQSGNDCSHWCLPGLPDTWNQLLYAALIM